MPNSLIERPNIMKITGLPQFFYTQINFKIYMEYQIIKSSQNTLEENKLRILT